MSEPFLAEIRLFSFSFPPRGWANCNGQLLPINQNQALFSLMGTMYGGDGRVNFALPDLRGRLPIHISSSYFQGARGGEQAHTLLSNEIPAHTHPLKASSLPPNRAGGAGNFFAAINDHHYSNRTPDTSMNPGLVQAVGGNQAHLNMQPFLVLNFCIALQGIFPSRN